MNALKSVARTQRVKQKTPSKGNVPGVKIRQQAKGWMDGAQVRDWINIVLGGYLDRRVSLQC